MRIYSVNDNPTQTPDKRPFIQEFILHHAHLHHQRRVRLHLLDAGCKIWMRYLTFKIQIIMIKMQSQDIHLQRPRKDHITIGGIEIRVISKPKIGVEQLEGILKLKDLRKSSTELVRDLRRRDYEREEKRLGFS